MTVITALVMWSMIGCCGAVGGAMRGWESGRPLLARDVRQTRVEAAGSGGAGGAGKAGLETGT